MTTNNVSEEVKTVIENDEDPKRTAELRKGFRSFMEVMITICIIAISILLVFSVFPLPREVIDRKTRLVFVMELLAFFPAVNILEILMTFTGMNKKENVDLKICILIYIGSYALLGNVIYIFLLRNIG